MNALLMAACAVVLVLGVFGVIAGLRRLPPRPPRAAGRPGRLTTIWRRSTRRHRLLMLGGLAAGLACYLVTGWPVTVLAVPVAVVGLPVLLADPSNEDIELLEALDRWVRSLGATIATGRSITDALRASKRQAPPVLAPGLDLTIARLDDRWSADEALHALADDLDNSHADTVLAALMLAAQRGGTGLSATLTALSDSIQDRLKALREIEAERAKPRVVVRQVTTITVVVLGLALLLGRSYFAPFGTPVGQVVLLVLLGMYVASLLMLRTMTKPRRRERVLQRVAAP